MRVLGRFSAEVRKRGRGTVVDDQAVITLTSPEESGRRPPTLKRCMLASLAGIDIGSGQRALTTPHQFNIEIPGGLSTTE